MDDLISRKAAIEALRYAQHRFTVADEAGGMGTVKWSENVIHFDAAVNALSFLPSAQPVFSELCSTELTCDGCKWEKNGRDLCYQCCRGWGDMYEEREENG